MRQNIQLLPDFEHIVNALGTHIRKRRKDLKDLEQRLKMCALKYCSCLRSASFALTVK